MKTSSIVQIAASVSLLWVLTMDKGGMIANNFQSEADCVKSGKYGNHAAQHSASASHQYPVNFACFPDGVSVSDVPERSANPSADN